MNFFPDDITEAQITCALRFDGYKYAESKGKELAQFSRSVVKTLNFYNVQEDNFTAFFALQRFLFKWGGERNTKYSEEHIAFDLLFLHLYKLEVPSCFANQGYVSRWNRDFKDSAETTAAFVRNTFRRKGEGPKVV